MTFCQIRNMYTGMPIPGTFGMMVDVVIDYPYVLDLMGYCKRFDGVTAHTKDLGTATLGPGWWMAIYILNHIADPTRLHTLSVNLSDAAGYVWSHDSVSNVYVVEPSADVDMHGDGKKYKEWPADAKSSFVSSSWLPPTQEMLGVGFVNGYALVDGADKRFAGKAPEDITLSVARIGSARRPGEPPVEEELMRPTAVAKGAAWEYVLKPAMAKHRSELRFTFMSATGSIAVGVPLTTRTATDVKVIHKGKARSVADHLTEFPPKLAGDGK